MARAKKASSDLISFGDDTPSFDREHSEEQIFDSMPSFDEEPSYDAAETDFSEEPKQKPKKAPVAKKPKSTSTKGHYITNAVLFPEVIRAKELGRITNELARMLMLITERLSCKSNFVGYSFREDMVSFAIVNLMANALKFNPEKSNNPFAFYTTSIINSFLQYLADEKKHRDIRDSLIVEEGLNPSSTFTENSREDISQANSDNY